MEPMWRTEGFDVWDSPSGAELAEVLHRVAYNKEAFRVTRASSCIMRNDETDISVLAHGDDFVSIGDEDDLQRLQKGARLQVRDHLCCVGTRTWQLQGCQVA